MSKKLTFEQSIEKLETTINKLQSGDLDLDASINEFKEGLDVANQAKKKLEDANLKVQKIIKEDSELKLEDLDVE